MRVVTWSKNPVRTSSKTADATALATGSSMLWCGKGEHGDWRSKKINLPQAGSDVPILEDVCLGGVELDGVRNV
jgi:hypothetical protein